MDWMDIDLDPYGWDQKSLLVHYNPLFFSLKKLFNPSIIRF